MSELTRFLHRFRGYLADPLNNGPELLVAVGLLLAVVGIIVVLALWVRFHFVNRKYRAFERARKTAERDEPVVDIDASKVVVESDIPGAVPPERRPLPWRSFVLAASIALILWVAATVAPRYTLGKASYCGSCHATKRAVKSWRASKHSKVSCQACHEGPGLGGIIGSQIQGVSNLSLASLYWRRHRPIALKTPVSPGCLGCHREILKKIVILDDTVKVSHREFVDSTRCETCHPNAGHAGKKLKGPLKNKCVACHEEEKASLACPTCHLAEPAWSKGRRAKYGKAILKYEISCPACHESEMRCVQCHEAPEQPPADDD